MGCEDEVVKIGKKLEKMIVNNTADHGSAPDLLKTLRDLPMTLEVLQKTRIGMTVNNFRKASSNDDVITLAKSLIKSWKKLLSTDGGSQSSSQSSMKSNGDSLKESVSDSQDGVKDEKPSPSKPPAPVRQTSFPVTASDTADQVRLKCRELLTNALKIEDPPSGSGEPGEIAASIEDAVFKEFGGTDIKYKNRIRSRVANLKDSRNPALRENVLVGNIAPEQIAKMTSEEMASKELKDLRAKMTKDAINDHQMAQTGGTNTDLLKCGKCLKNNCTYNQVQTRSADEPMTTFVLCNNCGHRWKFC
ncbi:transcription elongation factor A protein 1-like [Liolophura sinensis]|uniref:transcription elongation factor A protein 1-like n=1 Tax=Liolophura sinensis TaxID=3198878 RepID=UPI0031585470